MQTDMEVVFEVLKSLEDVEELDPEWLHDPHKLHTCVEKDTSLSDSCGVGPFGLVIGARARWLDLDRNETKAHEGRSKGTDLPSTCKRYLSNHAPLEDHLGRAGTVCNICLHFIDMTVLAKDLDKRAAIAFLHRCKPNHSVLPRKYWYGESDGYPSQKGRDQER
ncbi:hypothetical protein ZEAMMB73_Zm00001d035324 [Zea mays]|uniref:Uncharacterized protein n=1 Tax=Zea mays TaxID=4577 RepID=A0A1D6LFG5_MAIZE|nr:hypothetical protein ZEAMMB73_Zm00001d035324 [Zea mays]